MIAHLDGLKLTTIIIHCSLFHAVSAIFLLRFGPVLDLDINIDLNLALSSNKAYK